MIHSKKFISLPLLAAVLCVASTASLRAQGPGGGRPHPPHGPPPSPLFDALDTNHDGVISADEMANAPAALKALLKNGATQITRDDVRPPHPPGMHGDMAHEGGRPHDDAAHDDQAARPHPQDADHASPAAGPDAGPAADEARKPDADGEHGAGHAAGDAEHFHHHGPPPSPLFDALDTNHDGVISADEMANAPAALKALDKSGTGQIKREDLRPPHPPQDNH